MLTAGACRLSGMEPPRSWRTALILAGLVVLAAPTLPAQSARRAAARVRPGSGWLSRGIGGGGALYSPAISPHEPDEIVIATDMSAVFWSTSFGARWRVVPFGELQGGVSSEVRFTADREVLYAINCAEDLRIPVRSDDGGRTWAPLASDPTDGEAYTLFTDPASSDRLLVAAYDRLYLSNDGGASFTEVHRTPDEHVAGVIWNGDDVFVGTREGLLYSVDGGATFTLAASGGIPSDEEIVSFAGATSGGTVRLYAVTLSAGDVWPLITGGEMWEYRDVYRLDWGHGGWVAIGSGLPGGAHPFFVAASPGDIDTVYLAGGDVDTSFPIVFRSGDGGGSWVSVFRTSDNANIATGWSGNGGDHDWWYGEYALGLAVAPTDPDRVVLTDLGFVHVSDDGGVTWRQAYVDRSGENPVGAPTPRGRAYSGSGLEDTSSWWLEWADRDTVAAGFSDIHGIVSTDGGRSWSAGVSHGLPDNSTYCIVADRARGLLYAATSSVHDLYQSTHLTDDRIDNGVGRVMVSSDRGANWQTLRDFGLPVVWLALDPEDPERLYASVVNRTEGGIWTTGELGRGPAAKWTRLAQPPRTEGHPLAVRVLPDGALAVTYSGRRDAGGAFTTSSGVFLSTDGGASWEDRSDPAMLRWTKDLVVDPHDPSGDTWYVAVFSHWGSPPNEVGGLYRTRDRGATWQRVAELYRVESCAIDPVDPERLFLTTETQGMWSTTNLRAATPLFTPVAGYPFRHPTRVVFNPFDPGEVWATSFGNGLRVSRVGARR